MRFAFDINETLSHAAKEAIDDLQCEIDDSIPHLRNASDANDTTQRLPYDDTDSPT